ncbi:type A chloramphenicol O-acetyltransferase [Bacillus haynesii]|uniref:Chloramphenicol acetyltransferase n=1 Tax=Bacillus haynesii TaxID=1925021 RepID=A0AA90J9M5_9BACI|nr:type A chloramphenicol O-acetyltransferase [Bacillus haynesii]MCY7771522.1 type A chloramphenicol O-acetyltransferase [Bacillus haynesii]MCY7791192.1 type A chloramphenicol O-acetyltransferase [Bacillus haynesii]MCY8012356.1 type A chloramphenicol O-acetyltransferase [Bacillus haynesii]MCY8076194.1 type A chloramphenicol O-acetyltransferase [Bacillus haynesii]MCY8345089.1 type A chloramphenicol O-acetyltransferase [Bacillus haynesii]
MNFQTIELDTWYRKTYFDHYMKEAKCSFSITANVNVTNLLTVLKKKKIKLYPAFIYIVSRVIHSRPEFRTTFDDKGQLGYWEQMHPCYTIFHQDDQTFSALWTEYSDDFSRFYRQYLLDAERFGDKRVLWAKPDIPPNTFSVSSIPWVRFTNFNLNLDNSEHLLPIITNGKYFSEGRETFLPVSLQVHHAVCDGYHAGAFMNELERLAADCEEWLV